MNDIEKALEILKEERKSYEWKLKNIPKNCTEVIESIKDMILIVNTTISALEKQLKFINDRQYEIFKDVLNERHRQDSKWGEQNHVLERWTGILGEEYGELCEAINETVFDNGTDKGGYKNMRKEAIHVAAVAIGFLEFLERHKSWIQEVENEMSIL